jgi:hypothetical protein
MTLLLTYLGHTPRLWPLLRWHTIAAQSAFPGHAGRVRPLLRWRSVARIVSEVRA